MTCELVKGYAPARVRGSLPPKSRGEGSSFQVLENTDKCAVRVISESSIILLHCYDS